MVRWGFRPRAGEEVDSGCLPVVCRSLSPSRPGRIFAMLELCQEEAFPAPEGWAPRWGKRRQSTGLAGDGKSRVLGGTLGPWRRAHRWLL